MKVYRRTILVVLQGDRAPLFPSRDSSRWRSKPSWRARGIKFRGIRWDQAAERIPPLRFVGQGPHADALVQQTSGDICLGEAERSGNIPW